MDLNVDLFQLDVVSLDFDHFIDGLLQIELCDLGLKLLLVLAQKLEVYDVIEEELNSFDDQADLDPCMSIVVVDLSQLGNQLLDVVSLYLLHLAEVSDNLLELLGVGNYSHDLALQLVHWSPKLVRKC